MQGTRPEMLESGVDIVTISSILVNSKIMTSLLYSHTDRIRMRAGVEKAGGLLYA
jgi:hypothetical protein